MSETRAFDWTLHGGHALLHTAEMALPAAIVLVQAELTSLSDLDLGLAITVGAATYGLGNLPAGWLVDRIGPRVPLAIFAAGSGLSLIGLAASSSLAAFIVFATLLGASMSLYHPTGLGVLHALHDREHTAGGAFARHGLIGNLAVSLAPLLVGGLGALIGWRPVFLLIAGALFAYALLALRLPWPESLGRERPSVIERAEKEGTPRLVLRLALVLATTLCAGAAYRGLTSFLPKIFVTALDLGEDPARAGLYATLSMSLGLGGILAAGALADRGASKPLLFAVLCALQALAMAPLALVVGAAAVPFVVLAVFAAFMTRPVSQLLAVGYAFPQRRSLSLGLYFLVSSGAGASIGPALTGWLSEEHGLLRATSASAGLLVLASVFALALKRTTRELEVA